MSKKRKPHEERTPEDSFRVASVHFSIPSPNNSLTFGLSLKTVFKVMGLVGRRILTMCSLPSTCLVNGRIVFPSEFNKSRKQEYARLPEPIYRELEAMKGPTFP